MNTLGPVGAFGFFSITPDLAIVKVFYFTLISLGSDRLGLGMKPVIFLIMTARRDWVVLKKVTVNELKPGHVVAAAVCNPAGAAILQEGIVLTNRYIERLRQMRITSVMIKPESAGVSAQIEKKGEMPAKRLSPSVISPEARPHARPHINASARSGMKPDAVNPELRSRLSGLLDYMLQRSLPAEMDKRFPYLFHLIMREIVSEPRIERELEVLWQYDRHLFQHAFQVAWYSGMLGMAAGYDRSRLLELATGAILSDIGMTALPQTLIKKAGVLSEEERQLLHAHPAEGHRRMLELGLPVASAKCALQHHERYDGSGYPHQLKREEISEEAQIVAICDVYDALLSPRMYRHAYTETETLEFLFAAGHSYFHIDLVKLFLRYVASYPESRAVRLSNGQIGLVAGSGSGLLHRPIVRVIREADGTPVMWPYEINLSHKPEITIIHSLKEQLAPT